MSEDIDWLQIFKACEENVKAKIQLLKKSPQLQSELGIGAGGDPIKPVDLAAESAIVETIQERNLSFTLISEESGIRKFGNTPEDCYLTIDPIDGTTNLVHGLPFYCSSIAVSRKPSASKVFAALVTDLHHDISYTAIEGKGAQRNGQRITPSQNSTLNKALIGLDLNTYKIQEIIPQVNNLIQHTKHIRHFGANALEICYVADGSTDAFVDLRGKLRATDVAAAFLILKEAGGTLTTPDGQPVDLKLDPKQKTKFVASGNPKIHKALLDLITTGKQTC
jgi:myo-inositol-1(or 4)-monophosphatase